MIIKWPVYTCTCTCTSTLKNSLATCSNMLMFLIIIIIGFCFTQCNANCYKTKHLLKGGLVYQNETLFYSYYSAKLQKKRYIAGSFGTRCKRPKSPTPNFTMINKRDPLRLQTPDVKALVTTSRPIPNLLDRPAVRDDVKPEEKTQPGLRKTKQLWKEEIVK